MNQSSFQFDITPLSLQEQKAIQYSDKYNMINIAKEKGEARALTMMFQNHFARKIREGTYEYPEEFKQFFHAAKLRNETKSPYCYITIGAYPNIPFSQLHKQAMKFAYRKIIDSAIWVYEITSTDEKNPNLHSHMLVKYNCRPDNLLQGAKSTFNSVCMVQNPNILNFRFIHPDLVQSKIKYMRGEKSDKKSKTVRLTNNWRSDNDIMPEYRRNPSLLVGLRSKTPLPAPVDLT